MIVLDQHGFAQSAAVVPAAAAAHGVFFQPPPAGRGLAGVEDAGFRVGHQIDVLPRQRGDAREASQQIQQRPFGGEQTACGPFDDSDAKAFLGPAAVLRLRQPLQPGISSARVVRTPGSPATTPGWRATTAARPTTSSPTSASVVQSPQPPKSSAKPAAEWRRSLFRAARPKRFVGIPCSWGIG